MERDQVCDKIPARGKDYEKGFVRGVAWLLFLNPDFDNLPDFLKDFALSEISKSDS